MFFLRRPCMITTLSTPLPPPFPPPPCSRWLFTVPRQGRFQDSTVRWLMRGTGGSSVISGMRDGTSSVISASTFSSAGGRGGGGRSLVLSNTGSSVHAGGMGGARGGEPLSPGTASARDDGELNLGICVCFLLSSYPPFSILPHPHPFTTRMCFPHTPFPLGCSGLFHRPGPSSHVICLPSHTASTTLALTLTLTLPLTLTPTLSQALVPTHTLTLTLTLVLTLTLPEPLPLIPTLTLALTPTHTLTLILTLTLTFPLTLIPNLTLTPTLTPALILTLCADPTPTLILTLAQSIRCS